MLAAWNRPSDSSSSGLSRTARVSLDLSHRPINVCPDMRGRGDATLTGGAVERRGHAEFGKGHMHGHLRRRTDNTRKELVPERCLGRGQPRSCADPSPRPPPLTIATENHTPPTM